MFKFLSGRFKAYENAAHEISETSDILDHYGFRIETQLQLLQVNWNTLEPQYQDTQARLLRRLQAKLQAAALELDEVNSDRRVSNKLLHFLRPDQVHSKKLKYALHVQTVLRTTIDEVERWAGLFDTSWFLLTRNFEMMQLVQETLQSKRNSDGGFALQSITVQSQALPSSHGMERIPIFLPPRDLTTTSIPFSQARQIYEHSSMKILDTRRFDRPQNPETTANDVRILACALQKVDPAISGLLQCKGVIKSTSADSCTLQYDFIFRVPQALSQPRGLRGILIEANTTPLNERIHLAKSLAHAVGFLHNIRLVHKNISPETCIVFHKDTLTLGIPFLVGLDRFRLADGQSLRAGDDDWAKNIYRHPTRQGTSPEDRYIMQHDVYSLGVLLLEIDLWASFVTEAGEPTETLAEVSAIVTKDRRMRANQTKKILIEMAHHLLPKVDVTYRNVVLACLTCLDKENNLFGDEAEFTDQDGIIVGVRYIEKVSTFRSLRYAAYVVCMG